ncbi:major facilitator superfamily [Nannochloropsis gaditana]|uniref:Major facilitator superfamily n=1 Tax=Nannochloropsis gaditana TaxID=72520 RepID=W7TQ53_9STRA|nr:major facilitator superfamily [Nannochloropsis gaditana]
MPYWRSLSPAVPLVGQGLAYSAFAAVLWPSVPFTVPEDRVGVAYGLTTAIQNAGLALFPLMAAAIYKAAGSEYIPHVELLFVYLAVVGLAFGLWLNVLDSRGGGGGTCASFFLARLCVTAGIKRETLKDRLWHG